MSYPGQQPLFFAPEVMDKVAGYKMPTNPKLWQSEIIRYLKSQHPYLPLDTAEIDIRRLDVSKGAAVGSVILENEVAIPVIISRPKPGSDPELAPMDVFFYQGRYRHLDPDTVASIIHKPQIGEPESSPASRAVGGNPYVGDVTGDATPLEYSGQASPFAGPFQGGKTASERPKSRFERMSPEARAASMFGVTGAVGAPLSLAGDVLEGKPIVHGLEKGVRPTRAQIAAALGKRTVRGGVIGSTSGYIGTKALRAVLGADRGKLAPEAEQQVKKLVRQEVKKQASLDPGVYTRGLMVVVESGMTSRLMKSAAVDPNDINEIRRVISTNPALIQGLGNNLAIIDAATRRQPEAVKTVGVKQPNIVQVFRSPPGSDCVYVKFSGAPPERVSDRELRDMFRDRYEEVMRKLDSGKVVVESDGVNRVSWDVKHRAETVSAIANDGMHLVSVERGEAVPALVARQMVTISGQVVPKKLVVSRDGRYAIAGEAYGKRLSGRGRLPSSPPRANAHGVFVTYVHGTPMPTTPMTVKAVRSVTGDDGSVRVLYIVEDHASGERVTLVPVTGAQGFERMRIVGSGVNALAEGSVFYMPADVEWVTLSGKLPVAETPADISKIASEQGDDDDEFVHVTSDGALWNVKTVLAAAVGPGFFVRHAGKLINPILATGGGRHALIGAGVGAGGGALSHMASNDPQSSLLARMAGGAALGAGAGGSLKPALARMGSGTGRVGAKIRAASARTAGEVGRSPLALGEMQKAFRQARAAELKEIKLPPVPKAPKPPPLLTEGSKTASYDALPEWEARELLVAMGMNADGAQWALDEARSRPGLDRGVKLAGLHAPQIQGYEVFQLTTPSYSEESRNFASGCRPSPGLRKAAALSGHPETVDAVLSLEFITPQNLKYFVDSIEDMDETTSRLAAMLVAVRLGMPHVPEEPVRQSLEGLTKTVNKLRVLKSALEHRSAEAADTATP